jgi:hypothetical protein
VLACPIVCLIRELAEWMIADNAPARWACRSAVHLGPSVEGSVGRTSPLSLTGEADG